MRFNVRMRSRIASIGYLWEVSAVRHSAGTEWCSCITVQRPLIFLRFQPRAADKNARSLDPLTVAFACRWTLGRKRIYEAPVFMLLSGYAWSCNTHWSFIGEPDDDFVA